MRLSPMLKMHMTGLLFFWLVNNGDGSFATAVNYAVGASPSTLVLRDLNGDGKADVAVANWHGGVTVVLNTSPDN